MKKTFSSGISAVLVIALLAAIGIFPVSAQSSLDMTSEQWADYWTGYTEEGAAVYLAPGSDPSEMGVAWLGSDNCADPTVYVKVRGSLGDYEAFTGVTVSSASVPASYHVTVTGLAPDTEYSYYCSANGVDTDVEVFKTSAADSFDAIFVSDIHVSYSEDEPDNLSNSAYALNEIFAQAYAQDSNVSIILSAGDQADHGLLCEYTGVFSSPLMKNIPMATACGNHDYKETVYAYVTNNPNVYNQGQAISPDCNGGDYWFVKNDVLFLYINSNWISAGDHYDFVKQAVEANPDVKWRVAVFHHDLYGGHIESREDENQLLQTMLVPILDEFKVDLVLMGHSHVFSRSHVLYGDTVAADITDEQYVEDANGTIYITTGSTCRPRGDVSEANPEIATDHISSEDCIYNIMHFTYDSITIDTYAAGEDEPFETFTLAKTSNEGGHPDEGHDPLYDVVGLTGTIANIFVNLGNFFEQLFESIGINF